MTPDLRRLCEAAEDAVDQAIIDAGFGRDHSVEAIVHAVLTELRKPSASLEAACSGICIAVGDENVAVDWVADEMRAAMIDALLAEPATA